MKKSVITLLIFLIMIISVSAVSAADDAPDLGASDDATISVANTDTAVAADKDVKNFTELNQLIAGDTTGELTLSSDYKYNGSGEMYDTITVDKSLVIDGNGSTIDGTGVSNSVFSITGSDVTLKNMKIVGIEHTGIHNSGGMLVLDNITFKGVNDPDAGVFVLDGILNITNCAFDFDNSIILNGNAKLGSPSVINIQAIIGDTWSKINYTARFYDDKNNKVFLNSEQTGTYGITINGDPVTSSVLSDFNGINGTSFAKSYGENVVNASWTALLNATVNTATVFIAPDNEKKDPTIDFTFSPNAPVWNDTVTVTVTINNYTDATLGNLTPTGTLTFVIQGESHPVELVNGSANYTIKNVPVGLCSILVDYSGDSFFNPAYHLEGSIDVGKRAPEINVYVNNDTVGQQTITIELPSDADGVINATIDGYSAYDQNNKQLVDGKYTFNTTLPAKDDGAYTITVKYTSLNSNYTENTTTVEFYAGRYASNITIDVANTTYGTPVSFTITLADGIEQVRVVVTDSNKNVLYENDTLNLTHGKAIVKLGVIAADEYNITVTSKLTDIYKVTTNSTLFKVAPANPDIVIDLVDNVVLFEDVNVTVTVRNAKNDGWMNLTVGTWSKEIELDENGTAKFTVPASARAVVVGENVFIAEFTPAVNNDNYTNNKTNVTRTVSPLTPSITVTVDRVNINEDATVIITVNPSAAEYAMVPTGGAAITLVGDDYVIDQDALDANGQVTLVIPKSYVNALGTFDFNVRYYPATNTEKNYTTNITQFSVVVSKWDVEETIITQNVTVKDDFVEIEVSAGTTNTDEPAFADNFTVSILDKNGQVVNETSVALVNGVSYTIQYNTSVLGAGVFTAKISYAGDDNHYENTTTSDAFSIQKVIENLTIVVDTVNYPDCAVAIVNATADGVYIVNITGIDKNYTVTVKDGIGNVTLDLLAPGNYNINVTSSIEGYVQIGNTTSFAVDLGTINATLSIDDVVYLNNATAIVTANVDGNYTIKRGSFEVNVTVENGQGRVSFALDSTYHVGEYTFELYAPVNDNYTESNKKVNETKFNVTNGTIKLTITVENVDYPNQANVTINSTVPGDYRISVNGTDYDVTIAVGESSVSKLINTLNPGTYEVNVTSVNIANYNPVKENTTFTVNKGNLVFSLEIADVIYPNKATVILNADVAGKQADEGAGYAIYLGDTLIKRINGNATDKSFDLEVLAVGTYTVKVVPWSNDTAFVNYNVNESTIYNTTSFKVNKGAIELTISVADPTYPAPAELIINTNVAGNYTVVVGDIVQDVVLANGPNTVPIYGLDVNSYTATVISKVANYTETSNSTVFIVKTGTITAGIAITNVPFGTQPVITITDVVTTNGTFYVNVNGKKYYVNVVNGTGSANITDNALYVGAYNDITWGANIPNYDPYIGAPASFNVYKAPVALTIEVTSVVYPTQAVATVSANVSGTYSISVGGYSYNVTIDTNPGVMASTSQVIDLLAVTTTPYTATVDVVEINGNFTAQGNTTEFNVTKGTPKITIEVPSTYNVLENVTINITVPLGTGKVNITDSYGFNKIEQLVNGTYKCTIPEVTGIGTHVVYVELIEDQNFTNTISQATYNVIAIPTAFEIIDNKPVYEDDVIIKLNITGLVPGHNPTGNIVIADYATVAASADELTFNLGKLAGGEYTLNVTYTGDNIYGSCSDSYTFIVETYTPTVNATAIGNTYPGNATVKFNTTRSGNFTITVIDATGSDVQYITVNDVTNDTEKVVEIAGLAAGNYTFKVSFNPDRNYTKVTNTTNVITIKQAAAVIDAIVNDAAYPYWATVDLNATQDGYYTIYVYDSEGNIVDVESGSIFADEPITVDLAILDAGNYTVNITYVSANYTAEPFTDDLTIEKGEPIIDINVGETTFPEKAVLNITSSADGNFTVYIDGEIFANGTFTAGEPVFITAGLLSADYHDVLVTYDGNENYDPKTEYDIFTINQGAPEIFLYVDNKEILQNSTLYILIPYGNGNITVNGKSMELNYSENYHFGFAQYNIGILKAETYDLTVIYYGNENLTSGDNFTSFTVNKLPSNLKVIVENTTYGIDPHAFITIDNIDEINLDLYVDGEYAKTIKVVNGTSDGYLSDLFAGEHNFTVAYAGSDVYEAETVTADFTIAKADVKISIDGDNVTYPGDVVVTVSANVTGKYVISCGLDSKIVYLAAYEEQNVTFRDLDAGDHYVFVDYEETENYNDAWAVLEVTVEKGDVTMTIVPTSDIVDYPNPVVVTVMSDVAGSYLVFANRTYSPINVTLEANKPVDVAFYDLEVGLYEMAIVYLGSDNYDIGIELANVTVIKAPVDIIIETENVAYPADVVVNVTVDVYGEFNVTVGDVTKTVYLTPYETRPVVFPGLDGGFYEIIVSCPETENYNATTAYDYVYVVKTVDIDVDASDVNFPEDVIVTVKADVAGNYTVKVGTVSYDVNLEANVAKNVTFAGLAAGTYDVTVSYPGTEVYDPTVVTTSVTVNKGTPEIVLLVDTTTILENANLTVIVPYATGNVVLVNGKPVVLVDGVATYNIGTLKAETYDFTVVYSGDDNLNFGTASDSFTVEKLASNLDVFVDNSTYGVPAFSYISLNNTDYVTVQLWLDDEFINFVNIIGGRQTKYVTDVAAGEHTIKVVYDGSDVYNADEKSYNFTIAKAEVTITVDAANVTYPEDVVVSVMSDVAGTYGVTIGDTTKSVVLEANVAKNVTFAGLAAGTHEIAAFFTGNENYTSSVEYADAIVNKVENTPVYIYATSPIASENATIYVYVPTDATGNVTVKYGNGVYTAEIVDGEAVVSVPTSTIPGTDNASVSYSGDDNYEGATDEVEVTVLPNGYVIAENIRRGVNSPYDYYATLVDLEGNPIAGVELTFTILGQTFKATTNASGIATVSAGLSVVNGSDTVYDVTVTNPYSFKNVTATTTIVPRLIVCSGDLTADYLTNPAYVVQAIGDDGNPVGAGVVVRIVFAGFYYDLETNATGHVKRTIGLAPGMYAVRGEYMGYITNQTVFVVKQVMKVTSGTLKKTAKSYTLKATLKSSDGIAIAGETVKLTFNGKTYTVKTDSKGVASYTIKSSVISKLKAGQTYELKAKYENDIVKGKIKVVSK